TALTMIDADISECSSSINSINNTVQNLDAKSLRIPTELVGQVNTELTNIQPRRYVVMNEDASGFSTVEGGGGEGGKKGELLVKKSDKNFDTMWIDPRAILKKSPTVKETISDVQLPNNGTMILNDSVESESIDDVPRHGLTQRQINSDTSADSSYTYILCDTIDDTAEDESDIATREKFGRVKIGSGINVNNGEISVPVIGVASENNFGLVKIGSGLNVNDGVVSAQTYTHADHENFGIIKPSEDFNFDSRGALQLANRSEDIIYQRAAKNIVEDGVIKIVPTCAYYRAFIDSDTQFSFDWGDFVPRSDIAFDLEIVSDGTYVVNFGSNVIWELPCAGVNAGTTIIHFEKQFGISSVRGSLVSSSYKQIKDLMYDDTDDIQADLICGTNGCVDNLSYIFTPRHAVYHDGGYTGNSSSEVILYVDFMRSTFVDNIWLWPGFSSSLTAQFFVIEGSVDRQNWTILYEAEAGSQIIDTELKLTRTGHFRHYRLRFSKNFRLRGFKFYGYYVEDELFEWVKVFPQLTENSSNGYVITSSGTNDGALSNITNNSISSYANFSTKDENGKYWIKYELPEAEVVNMIDIASHRDSADRFPKWFKIEASNDDQNWTLLLERAWLSYWNGGTTQQYYIENSTAYKYYRFTPIELSSTEFRLARWRLYRKVDGILSSKGFIPSLTSTSQGGYEVSASSQYNGDHSVLYAFDGNTSTRWATIDGDTVGGWIQVKFPTETLCTAAWLTARNDSSYGQAPSAFKILGSVDGENFDTIKTIANQEWTQGEQKIFDFYNTIPYLYYRIEAVTIQNGGSYFGLSEVNFGTRVREYKRVLNTYRKLTPVMSANSQDGFVVTASDTYSGGRVYFPYLAFNNVISDSESWTVRAQSGWIQIELPEADKANMFRMSGGFSNEEPDSFVLYGSNDGENYDELLNSGALTWTHNETKTWNLENNTAYKFYKIEAVNTKKNFITISEIQLIEQITTREY
ncbi:MAG: discoidin domain-containing protein, partial [Alphaproteobacteria bacterium]|nr:discoidin domain-containing protein [Alphaproteobacteria bacterium]